MKTEITLNNGAIATITTDRSFAHGRGLSSIAIICHHFDKKVVHLNKWNGKNATQKNLLELHNDAIEIFKQQQSG